MEYENQEVITPLGISIESLMKETGAVEIQIGEYKVKRRKTTISLNKYFKNKLNGMFGFLKRKKK